MPQCHKLWHNIYSSTCPCSLATSVSMQLFNPAPLTQQTNKCNTRRSTLTTSPDIFCAWSSSDICQWAFEVCAEILRYRSWQWYQRMKVRPCCKYTLRNFVTDTEQWKHMHVYRGRTLIRKSVNIYIRRVRWLSSKFQLNQFDRMEQKRIKRSKLE